MDDTVAATARETRNRHEKTSPRQRPDGVPDDPALPDGLDPPLVPVAWENILDIYYNYVKGHNPKEYFGIYDVVRFDTFWLDK